MATRAETRYRSLSGSQREASVTDMIEALGLMEEAAFSRRFHEAVGRHPDPEVRDRLKGVPDVLTESALSKRLGARVWERTTSPVMEEAFLREAEQLLLKTFLLIVESDIRITTHVAQHAPTAEVRRHFDHAADVERNATRALRQAAERLGRGAPALEPSPEPLYCAQALPGEADLRGRIERTLQRLRGLGREPRIIFMSHVTLRRLKDQGCFQRGESTLMGTPVVVDLGWDAPEFAVQTYESVPLEEMLRE